MPRILICIFFFHHITSCPSFCKSPLFGLFVSKKVLVFVRSPNPVYMGFVFSLKSRSSPPTLSIQPSKLPSSWPSSFFRPALIQISRREAVQLRCFLTDEVSCFLVPLSRKSPLKPYICPVEISPLVTFFLNVFQLFARPTPLTHRSRPIPTCRWPFSFSRPGCG